MSDPQTEPSQTANDNSTSKSSRKGGSQNRFPRVPISKVLPLLEAVWNEGHGEQVRTTAAFAKLNRSHTSGPSRTLLATANSGYGLINGSYQSPFLTLTDSGRVVASSGVTRQSVLEDAVFRNDVFGTVYNRWLNRSLPSDQVICDFISSEKGFSEEDSKAAWSVISENLRFLNLVTRDGNVEVIIERGQSGQSGEPANLPEVAPASKTGRQDISAKPPLTGSVNLPVADFHFNIQIHLPSDASPEVYDSIFSSLSKHLLQRES